jgi:hypothetical protein
MAKKSKTPKIISGIIATISLIVALFVFLSPFWFWVSFEIIAAVLVAVGCFGEWWLHHHPAGLERRAKDIHHSLESKIIGMVAIGVFMELFALGHSIREGVKLENKLAEANERASTNELKVAELMHENLELKKGLAQTFHKRHIVFGGIWHELNKVRVEYSLVTTADDDSQVLGMQLNVILKYEGWKQINAGPRTTEYGAAPEYPQRIADGVMIGTGYLPSPNLPNEDPSSLAADVLVKVLATNNITAKHISDMRGRGLRITIGPNPSPFE